MPHREEETGSAADQLMARVRPVYETALTVRAEGEMAFLIDGDRVSFVVEVLFKFPKLRVAIRTPETLSEVVIVSDGQEFHLREGRWEQSNVWMGTPTLLELFSLPSNAEYVSYNEGEVDGRPVQVVQGTVEGVSAKWWVERPQLRVYGYQLTGAARPVLGCECASVSCLQMQITTRFSLFEAGGDVPDKAFAVTGEVFMKTNPL